MKKRYWLWMIIIGFTIISCSTKQQISTVAHDVVTDTSFNIIPYPSHIVKNIGNLHLTKNTKIILGNEAFSENATYLNQLIFKKLGFSLEIISSTEAENVIENSIIIERDTSIAHDYLLDIEDHFVILTGVSLQGQFHAIQTLLQLIDQFQEDLPFCEIQDLPRFTYRGMHLDVARHFFPVSFIKKYIDYLAKYKYNTFHWHLTEDQGWRIEIKKYPKLQEIAAYRNETLIGHYSDKPHQFDGQEYGGFYLQSEIREVVAYAKERFITIIPEIEMPGHAQAAIAAYPELGCTGQQIDVATKWGVFKDVYCPNETTFQFLEDVLTEVMELFPSKYIHIGGDECPKTAWKESAFCQNLMKEKGLKNEHELQSYFIQRMEKFINSKGRKIIGWDEILEGGLAPNATVMSWRGMKGGIAAAKQGHDVIMTPGSHCYFDHYQSTDKDEPLAIGGFTSLEKVYSFEPTPSELNEKEAKHILGAQGNVWTEYMKTPEKIEYMIFPRMIALSEVNWSSKEQRNYSDFIDRLEPHLLKLKKEGVNVANHLFDVKAKILVKDGVFVNLNTDSKKVSIQYAIGDNPKMKASSKIKIEKSGILKAAAYNSKGEQLGKEIALKFNIHKAAGKKITMLNAPSKKYNSGGNSAIINGVQGSNKRYGDKEWLGFDGKDCIAIIDLGKPTSFQNIKIRFFNGKGQWIYPPSTIEVFTSDNGVDFKLISEYFVKDSDKLIVNSDIGIEKTKKRYLKIHVHRHGIIENGKQGGGHEAWLFVDEIELM